MLVTEAPTVSAEAWLHRESDGHPEELAKDVPDTRAWFASLDGRDVFAKAYPSTLREDWAGVERAIAGAGLHPAIVPLRRVVRCRDGVLHLYDRVSGENLGSQASRKRILTVPLHRRLDALDAIAGALAAIVAAGFVVVDWHEGNMLYDFQTHRVWLFDWELCRPGASFVLEMDENYGTSRLMAPEEFVRGSVIDERTLVLNVGRYMLLTVPELAEATADVLAMATHPDRRKRYPSVAELRTAFRQASGRAEARRPNAE
jgi:serine/threonine-protein kinase